MYLRTRFRLWLALVVVGAASAQAQNPPFPEPYDFNNAVKLWELTAPQAPTTGFLTILAVKAVGFIQSLHAGYNDHGLLVSGEEKRGAIFAKVGGTTGRANVFLPTANVSAQTLENCQKLATVAMLNTQMSLVIGTNGHTSVDQKGYIRVSQNGSVLCSLHRGEVR